MYTDCTFNRTAGCLIVVYSSNFYAMKWLSRKYAAQGEVRGAQHMNFIRGTCEMLCRMRCYFVRKEGMGTSLIFFGRPPLLRAASPNSERRI